MLFGVMLPVKDYQLLKKNLKRDFSGLKKVKIALLGDTATQFLGNAVRATGYELQLDLEIWEADFNQVERQIFDPASEFYHFKPEIVIIYKSSHKLLSKYNKLKTDQRSNLAQTEFSLISQLNDQINSLLKAQVLFYNYTEINDSVFGNYSSKVESSFLFQLRKLNYELMNYALNQTGFNLVDLSSLQNQLGKASLFNAAVYINTEMTLCVAALPQIAALSVDLIGALTGRFVKCVVLDLDNTLWGGIIGDDGMENIQLGALGIGKAFTEFQYWLKKLKERGIILAVCSKNTEAVAREPFKDHPDMVLRLDDIAVFVANWESKVDNINFIQKILNIGFDAMIFLDDNPFERNVVKENIPGLIVPELPDDPANYLEYLYTLNLFETASFSRQDTERTKQYQVEAQRTMVLKQFNNEEDFLKSLNMCSLVEPFSKFNIPRVAQLSQRSNQFNLRTVRYSETEIEAIALSNNILSFAFNLTDKFGDNGLICVVILKKQNAATAFIDTWLMSCRVLKRGMENFVLNTIVSSAIENGFNYLKGEYLPTSKNDMVKNHYADIGFSKSGDYWSLDLTAYQPKNSFITKK